MYCSSCGAAVAQEGLSYCKNCGARLKEAKGDNVVKTSEIKPELIISSMVALFIFGLGAIAVLLGVLKQVVGFDLSILLAITMFSFLLMLIVEGILIWLLLKGRRGFKKSVAAKQLAQKGQQTKEQLGEASARALMEPASSVTDHTTRTFEPIYSERKSK